MGATFVTLSQEECRERLAGASVGRVAFCTPQGPTIYPVNVGVVDGDVVFRTAPYTDLGTQVGGSQVALEVDELDPADASGWSVVVHGEAVRVDDPDEAAQLRRPLPEPWAPGQRSLFVRVVVTQISGRGVGGS
jgi:nitroimidazol reductase NimA-like FMN-containing flavoprotein (pyridoxamine 5'-phosphate oxidase superfamily)